MKAQGVIPACIDIWNPFVRKIILNAINVIHRFYESQTDESCLALIVWPTLDGIADADFWERDFDFGQRRCGNRPLVSRALARTVSDVADSVKMLLAEKTDVPK